MSVRQPQAKDKRKHWALVLWTDRTTTIIELSRLQFDGEPCIGVPVTFKATKTDIWDGEIKEMSGKYKYAMSSCTSPKPNVTWIVARKRLLIAVRTSLGRLGPCLDT